MSPTPTPFGVAGCVWAAAISATVLASPGDNVFDPFMPTPVPPSLARSDFEAFLPTAQPPPLSRVTPAFAALPEFGAAAVDPFLPEAPAPPVAPARRGLVRAGKPYTFQAPVSQFAWSGGSPKSCDAACKAGCLAVGDDHSQWGDVGVERADVCLAGCGCTASFENVFAVTTSGEARFSVDAGDTWSDVHDKIPAHLQTSQLKILSVHVSHTDPRSVVLLTDATASLISHDGGLSWNPVKVGDQPILFWQWHPTKPDWALAASHQDAVGAEKTIGRSGAHHRGAVLPSGSEDDGAETRRAHHHKRFFYTQDGGITWKPLVENAGQCRWAPLPGGDPRRVVATVFPPDFTSEASNGGLPLLHVVASDDFMQKQMVLLGKGAPGGGPFAATSVRFHYNFALALVPTIGGDGLPRNQGLQLWIRSEASHAPQTTTPAPATAAKAAPSGSGITRRDGPRFLPASWPWNMEPPKPWQLSHLVVLHSSEHSVMFFMPAGARELPWGHVFRCGALSSQIELLLSDVHHPRALDGPQWRSVSGIDGIFLANRIILDNGQDLDTVERRFDEQAANFLLQGEADSGIESEDTSDAIPGVQSADPSVRLVVRTYLSMDSGSAWQPLQAPDVVTAVLTGASAPTWGHRLHLQTWISSIAAPGVLVGVGNVGLRLSEEADHQSVFVSRDAGMNWVLALEGRHSVAMLSHGDIIVAVAAREPGEVRYSTDCGRNWRTFSLRAAARPRPGLAAPSAPAVEAAVAAEASVAGLIEHPSQTGWRLFLALRFDESRSISLTVLDFTDVLRVACSGPVNLTGDLAGSDFEKWSPADSLEDAHVSRRPSCLHGVKTRYLRRRADRQCKTGRVQLTPVDFRKDTPCECSIGDWACDVGFYRAIYHPDAICEPQEGNVQPNVTALCSATTLEHVMVTRGYVKTPGNRCVGGKDLSAQSEVCVGNTGFSALFRNAVALRFSHVNKSWVAFCAVLLFLLLHRPCGRGEDDDVHGSSSSKGGMFGCMPSKCMVPLGRSWRDTEDEDEEEREFLISGNCT
eukprot:TRINITY_DN74149_c0_g1_i1.p1 TRINITY_DN74149_c0_g1~~TRINITY_DN74149_c0_g1_i1.p1  ORF type:complete len:1034 (-),score=145.73 TRINITY_DN74149_c0_g1_i1:70-3171(-)